MKKILFAILITLLLTGCQTTKNTPTTTVETYLSKYQNLDKDVLKELDNSIKKDDSMSSKQKEEYKSIMEKQYQNLAYKIKEEEIIGNIATVEVEIEVLDYATTISNAKKYFIEHESEFIDTSIDESDVDENSNYIDYKIKKLQEVSDKTKYEITFDLEKENDIWNLKNPDEIVRQKIHGLY